MSGVQIDPKPKMTITGVSLPCELHALLVRAARGKQHKQGGRCSVSALIAEIVARHAAELQVLANEGD